MTSLVAEFALAAILIYSALWNRFLDLVVVVLSVIEPAYWEKGSSGPGVGIAAIVESAQATQASHVEAEALAEDVIVDEALADVIDEAVATEELLATDPLAETVCDGCVTVGLLPDGWWPVASGLSGPAFSIS